MCKTLRNDENRGRSALLSAQPHRALGVILIGLAAVAGCNRAAAPDRTASITPRELIDRMTAAYRQAKSYADSGQLKASYVVDGQPQDGVADFAVAFERPNKVRMHVYQAIVVSDGKQFWATVGNLPGQVLHGDAPPEMTHQWLYRDPALAEVLSRGLAGEAPQLSLLLVDKPFEPILAEADEVTLIAQQKIDDAACHGVRIARKDDVFTLWIDPRGYVLRRLDFEKKTAADGIDKLRYTADFRGARLNEPIDEVAFTFEAPAEARLVAEFDASQAAAGAPPRPPSDLLGKAAPDFAFTTLDGAAVSKTSLAHKVVVLDFWATWCAPCFAGFPNLEQVYQRYKSDPRVAIYAVSIDEPDVTNQKIEAAAAKAGLTVPILRDLDTPAREVFKVEEIPSMYILGADGTVEDHEIGMNPNLASELPERIEILLSGKSTHQLAWKRYEERRRAYEQAAGAVTAELPRADIPPATEPSSHNLVRLWTSADLERPGNIVAVNDGGATRLIVVDGLTTVGELDAAGKLIARHELDLPQEHEEAIVGFLRTAVKKDGQRVFVGTASDRQQVHVFDAAFKRLRSYPDLDAEGTHAGISDVQLADLDGDGEQDMNIGFYGLVGVQNVTLAGERRWWSRSMETVFRLAVVGPDASGKRLLLCAHIGGTLVIIDSQGQASQPVVVKNRFIRSIYAADLDGDEQPEMCAIAARGAGEDTLVGLDRYAAERWSYAMPVGVQPVPTLDMLVGGNLLGGSGQWIAAGADGSIHILSATGALVDKFQTGAAISGLAIATIDGKPALIVAAGGKVEALRLEAK